MTSKVIIELNPLFFSNSKPLKNNLRDIKYCRYQLNEKCCNSCKEYQQYINFKLKYYGENNRNYGKRLISSNDKYLPYKKRKYIF